MTEVKRQYWEQVSTSDKIICGLCGIQAEEYTFDLKHDWCLGNVLN